MDFYLEALRAVIGRHDALRTAIFWKDLAEPVQVVLREALLCVEEVELNGESEEDVAGQICEKFHPSRYQIDFSRAPLMLVVIAHDRENNRWLMLQLLHHLVIDDVSRKIIREEIRSYQEGCFDELPAAPQFSGVLATLHADDEKAEHRSFFRQMLADVEEPTIPFGLVGDGNPSTKASVDIDPELSMRIRSVSAASKVSAARLCHLAYALVLAKISGQSDVVFGTVVSSRRKATLVMYSVVGPLVNTLPIRIRVAETAAGDGIRHVDELLHQLTRHRNASLALAQECSSVPARAPLFTALFNYRHRAASSGRDPISPESQASLDRTHASRQTRLGVFEMRTNYPLNVAVNDLGDGFHIAAQVEGGIDPVRICSFMRTALESLVDALERAPGTLLRSLQVLPARERDQVLHEWNQTQMDYPSHLCLHERFEMQAKRTPGATAIVYENQPLTYGDLNRRANRLACLLREKGVGPDVIVGIGLDRSPEMVLALLGVLKAGGAYLPLDPAYPRERLAFMISDAQPQCVITSRALSPAFAGAQSLLCVDDPETLILLDRMSGAGLDHSGPRLTSANSACIFYTSGSTGRPRGVVLEHRNLMNRLAWMDAYLPFSEDETCIARVSLSFADSICEIFGPLSQGIPTVLTPESTGTGRLTDLLVSHGVTRLVLVPSLLRSLLESHTKQQLSRLKVRYWFSSGEALTASLARKFSEK